jgi:iron-sulfur cluster insertion protein
MLMALTDADVAMTEAAQVKMAELFKDIDENVQGVRVYAMPGGCSGISFGMTFADTINQNDGVREFDGYKLVVDDGTLEHVRGVEIDFIDRGNGNATFVFNNLPSSGGSCGSCGSSSGGGCS